MTLTLFQLVRLFRDCVILFALMVLLPSFSAFAADVAFAVDVDMLSPPEAGDFGDLEDVDMLPPPDDLWSGELEDGVDEAVLMTIEPLTFSEWFNRALDLFFDTLSWVMSVRYLRFFAVFSLFLVACNLLVYLMRTGRGLSH